MRVIPVTMVVIALAAACPANAVDFERTIEADSKGRVEISNVSGSVRVSAWDRPAVEVKATHDRGVERIDVERQGDRVVIKTVIPRRNRDDAEADLDVRIPRESEVEVSTVSADIHITGVQGSQRLKSVSGDVHAEAGGRAVEVKTVSGDISLRGSPQLKDARVETISGDLRLDRGRGEVVVTTVSGDLHLELDEAISLRARTTSGDIDARGAMVREASVEAETVSGSVDLGVKFPGGVDYDVTSFSGDIKSCFNVKPVRTSEYGPGSRLQGVHGEGGARLRVRTMNGDVDLCDR
jgi:DUF4097 and DUF4098 domain-containing protein YvlB